jgi:uncharacterized protein YndB with AHSA1/START domain
MIADDDTKPPRSRAGEYAARYELLTSFELAAPREAVYLAILEVAAWPSWWRGCLAVAELAKGDERGLGSRHRVTWRSRLPYELTIEAEVTEIVRGERIVVASGGDLDGLGTWTFTDTDTGTRVQYLWQVATRKRWMRLLAPLLNPLFRLNHDWLMDEGAQGLARHLGVAAPRVAHDAGGTTLG